MNLARYRKTAIAAAGVVLQILAAAGAAGAVPEQWRPWVNVIAAIATAVLVYRVPNEPMPAGRHQAGGVGIGADIGRARPVLLAIAAATLVLIAVGVPPAVAGVRHHQQPRPVRPPAAAVVDPVLLSAIPVCDRKTLISYRLDRYDPAAHGFAQADGPPPGVEAWLDGAWRLEPAQPGEAAGTLEITDPRAYRIRLIAGDGPGVPGFVQEQVHCG